MTSSIVTVAALAVAALVYALDRFNLLPKRRSSADAAGELLIAERTASRLRSERDQERARADKLEATRSMEPILDRLDKTAELQAEAARQQAMVLERLSHHNGSFRHMEETWREVKGSLVDIHRSFETLTAFVATLQGLPVDGGRGPNLVAVSDEKSAPRPRRTKRQP